MKKLSLIFISLIFLFGCTKSLEDEFNGANGFVDQKYIKVFQIINSDRSIENKTLAINYDGENKISSITDGKSNVFLNYRESNDLNTVTNDNESFDIDDLYQSPYDAFETGNVIKYDDNGNPVEIEVYEDGYGSEILKGEIFYDANPNPFFYTLKAAGIIDVIDRIELNFGYTNPAIIKARQLLPYNNIRAMIFKDFSGITKYEVHFEYNYDESGYPANATVSTLSQDGSSTYNLIYTYK